MLNQEQQHQQVKTSEPHQQSSQNNQTELQSTELQEPQQQQRSESDDEKYYGDSDWKFDLSIVKPFDLKAQWLGNTDDIIRKYQQKLTQVERQKGSLKKGLELFQQNVANYKRNSLRQVHFHFDKKKIYQQFMEKSRKPLQKLHPGLLLNIGSYVDRNSFYFLAMMRRVSKVFNFIYSNQEVVNFLSEKDMGEKQSLKQLQKISYQWLCFERTFLYYKAINYTNQIPPNSFKTDLQNAVNFINDIHKRIFRIKNFQLGYFRWVNSFMKTHRVVIALSTLSLTNLIMIRKPSIVAFSNYLALNPSERKKEEITKTRYSQVIKIVQDQNYKDCLIINTKVSNYLEDQHQYDFAVFIIHSLTGKTQPKQQFLDELLTYNILVFHKYNEQKSQFIKQIPLRSSNVLDTDKGICIRFNEQNLEKCEFSITTDNNFDKVELEGNFMNCLIRDHEKNMRFSEAFVYNEEYHYIIVIKNLLEYEPNPTHQSQ